MLLLLLFFSLRYKEGLDYYFFVNIVVIVVVLGYKEGLDFFMNIVVVGFTSSGVMACKHSTT